MSFSENYHNELLYLIQLVINADGVIDDNGLKTLETIKEKEEIPNEMFSAYKSNVVATAKKNSTYSLITYIL